MPSAIVLVVDGWQAGFSGCYGNAWVDTPALNRLATGSCCFDQLLVDAIQLDTIYRSYWRGVHALASDAVAERNQPLPERLAAAGVRQTLVSDAPDLFPLEQIGAFESHLVVPIEPVSGPAANIAATHTAEFFTAAIEQLNTLPANGLLWLHTSGFLGPWDAPLELREQVRHEDDLPARTESEPPSLVVAADHDPDELVCISQAYAAQAMLLDHGLQWMLEAIERSSAAREALLIVSGARGFALGEHGMVGSPEDALKVTEPRLHGELLHVPLLIRLPEEEAVSVRNASLVQPADMYATLATWFNAAVDELASAHPAAGQDWLPLVRDDLATARSLAVCSDEQARVARTELWQLLVDQETTRLYAKPDDRWEVNNIADRAEWAAQALQALLAEFESACGDPSAAILSPLPEELTTGQR